MFSVDNTVVKLLFWPLVLWFVWVVSLLAGTGQCHPNSERSTFLLCCQLRTDFHNVNTVNNVSAIGVGSSRTIYGMQWCASNHIVGLSERYGYLWYTFCVCPIHFKVHLRVGRKLELCRFISVQPSIGSTIREFSIRSALRALEVLCCVYRQFLSNRSRHIMEDGYRSKLINIASRVPQGSVLCPLFFLLYTSEPFSILHGK